MKIAVSSDHAGYELKKEITSYLKEKGFDFQDFGPLTADPVDYPDQALLVAKAVASGAFTKGIIICGTGIGISISANKIKGIRAALCSDVYSARMARAHNDANVLALGARVVGVGLALAIVEAFLNEAFLGGRHEQRVAKMMALENQ
ncbi:MAG TPA: ribose 5-phosphate isomerase B [Firmicutes bacterium]|jgi:ribose 5-phosphate isomerase B|nr:ribose 5-phosphate isomerase B [Bacillota bacterium]